MKTWRNENFPNFQEEEKEEEEDEEVEEEQEECKKCFPLKSTPAKATVSINN